MGDGTEQNPYIRDDVLRLIEENGGKAEGLDLSGKTFEIGIDLHKLDLQGIILDRAELICANLENSNLQQAYLRHTILNGANLRNADLFLAKLEGADISLAELEGARLYGADILQANLEEYVNWGDYILGDEEAGNFSPDAVEVYRQLKQWYTNAGFYDVAGEFFYREMEAKRKALEWWSNPFPRAWSKFLSLICGYGERPLRVIGWAATVVFGLAAVYYFWGSFSSSSFWDTLYYSAASFTALGYGQWAPQPTGWAKIMGAVEAFIGVFTMALFLITFVRKLAR